MKKILSEKGLVVILFILVLITFSFAQEDSKKLERLYNASINNTNVSSIDSPSQHLLKTYTDNNTVQQANMLK